MTDRWMTGLNDWGAAHTGLIALAGLALAALAVIVPLALGNGRPSPGQMLRDRSQWGVLINDLNLRPRTRYHHELTRLSAWGDRQFGRRLLSWRTLKRCLQVEFVLPVVMALIGWVAFDVTAPGGLRISEDGVPFARRMLAGGAIVLSGVLCAFLVRNSERISAFLRSSLFPVHIRLDEGNGFLRSAYYLLRLALIYWLPFAVAVAVASVVTVTGAGVVARVVIGAAVVAVFFAGIFAFIRVVGASLVTAYILGFAAAFPGVGIVAVVGFIVGAGSLYILSDQNAQMWLFFFVLLPLLNAFADTISVAATRLFLRSITTHTPTPFVIVAELFIDLIIALATLIVLIYLLALGLDLWARVHPGSVPLDWRAWRAEMLTGDLTSGTLLYGMVATTLIPTVVHVVAGVWAMARRPRLVATEAARRLEVLDSMLPPDQGIIVTDATRGEFKAIDQMLKQHRWRAVVAAAVALALLGLASIGLLDLAGLVLPPPAQFPIP